MEIKKREETITDFIHFVEKSYQNKEIKEFIKLYRQSVSFKATCIIDEIIPYCYNEKKDIEKEINYIEIIKPKLLNQFFIKYLINKYKIKKKIFNEKLIKFIY
jgi:hypothetical protein